MLLRVKFTVDCGCAAWHFLSPVPPKRLFCSSPQPRQREQNRRFGGQEGTESAEGGRARLKARCVTKRWGVCFGAIPALRARLSEPRHSEASTRSDGVENKAEQPINGIRSSSNFSRLRV